MAARSLRILDFDIENRPLSYLGADFTTAEITAIAASFGRDKPCRCWLLGPLDGEQMLSEFREMYERADMVTGHYIRRHDLPIVNGALLEFGLPPLSAKLSSDTKEDLLRFKDLSKSQESLGALLGLDAPKVGMNQHLWREANRLTGPGIAATKRRVVGDVRQHQELRLALLERGYLKPPKVWRP